MVNVDYVSNKHAHAAGIKHLSVRGNLRPANTCTTRKVCFSFAAYARKVIDHLRKFQISISNGLSDEEFSDIEREFRFTFPPDLKAILQEGLPVGAGFPDWRSGSKQHLRTMLNLPVDGLCSEITRAQLWLTQWGRKPADTEEALHKALRDAPTLVPIYSHCYIPSYPNLAGNPVFLIYEKDIFYCGYDLGDFFEKQAFIPRNFILESAHINGEGKVRSKMDEERSWECNTKRDTELKSVDEGEKIIQSEGKKPGGKHTNLQVLSPIFRAEESNSEISPPRKKCERSCRCSNENIHKASVNSSDARIGRENNFLGGKSLCDAPLHPLEKPETCIRSAENSPRRSHFIVSTYTYFHKHPLPKKVLSQFTIAAPPWAAKEARHIDLWSDLVENKARLNVNAPSHKTHYSIFSVDVDHPKLSHENHVESEDMAKPLRKASRCGRRWLSGYFNDMAKRLRNGGWTEDEITEMVDAVLPVELDITMALQVDALSAFLRNAGWSTEDVVEVLDSDLVPSKEKRAVLWRPINLLLLPTETGKAC
eukprot:c47536_g1_i2 orf=834-2444(+)